MSHQLQPHETVMKCTAVRKLTPDAQGSDRLVVAFVGVKDERERLEILIEDDGGTHWKGPFEIGMSYVFAFQAKAPFDCYPKALLDSVDA